MECGAKACLDPLWDLDKFSHALGLRQIFEINLINTAGLREMKCGEKACLDPLWDLDKFGQFGQFYNYSGSNRRLRWGKIC